MSISELCNREQYPSMEIEKRSICHIREKKLGIIEVLKLRAIILLEVDFNTVNKIIFNTRLIPNLEKNQSILIEI